MTAAVYIDACWFHRKFVVSFRRMRDGWMDGDFPHHWNVNVNICLRNVYQVCIVRVSSV